MKKHTRRAPVPGRNTRLQAPAPQRRTGRPPPAGGTALVALSRYTPPLTPIEALTTSRLLPARYSDSVLTRIADSDADLQLMYALDNATNERLLAEANSRLGITARELVFDVPYARIINAAFAHPHPQGARFSTPFRGAWYAGLELATCKAEVLFHRSVQFNEIGWLQQEALDYDHYHADFSGSFHDLRAPGSVPEAESAAARRAACLDPASYIASQKLAVELLQAGSLGVIYPSARRAAGTCLACFRPGAVANVRRGTPDAPPTFTRIPREGAPEPPKPFLRRAKTGLAEEHRPG